MDSMLQKCPVAIESLPLQNLSEDEEKFIRFCYYHSARDPLAVNKLTEFLDRGIPVDVQAIYGLTALHLTCLSNSTPNAIDIVRLLLERGADPNKTSLMGATALHMLIWLNHTETLIPIMALLIRYGANVNIRQENDENALHKLLRLNQTSYLLPAVRLLVENGIRINESGGLIKGYGSALHILCETNQTSHLLSVARYLVESGLSVNLKDDKNNSVLHLLCRYNQTEHLLHVIRFFVEVGTEINARNDQDQTALHVLCQYNQSEYLCSVVEYFLENHIQISSSINSPSTLSLVCKYNQTDQLPIVMKLLIPKEKINHADSDGCQATHLCAQYQKENLNESSRVLVANGANLAATNSFGETVLHLACQYADQLKLVFFVPSLGRSLILKVVDIPDAVGRTALHHAARSGCWKTVQFLAGLSNVRFLDAFGKCSIDYLEHFMSQKGTPLCLCCRGDRCFDQYDIEALYLQFLGKPTIQKSIVSRPIGRIENSIPVHIDHVYVFTSTDRYTRLSSDHNVVKLLHAWNNPDSELNFETIAASAGMGLGCRKSCIYRSCVWCNLLVSVSCYIRSLLDEVEKFDERFSTQRLVFYGSSAERTRLLQLDEFDFLVVLSNFAEVGNSGRVIYLGNTNKAAFLTHGDGRPEISSGRAIYYFYQIFRFATKRVDCSNIHVRDITFGETCVTLYLIYCGYGKAIPISIDITIGIARSSQCEFESSRELPPWCSTTEAAEFLVPFRDKSGPPEWRVSYPTLERDTILRAGEVVRNCFRILKLLVLLCQPRKVISRKGQEFLSQKTKPSTYALKTCLLRYMECNCPPWNEEDTIVHCIGILEVYLTHPGVHLKSFFNPELNVTYIDHQSLAVCSQICEKLRSCVNLK